MHCLADVTVGSFSYSVLHLANVAVSPGRWAVTVAGSCAAVLPADVEMRLRFPEGRARGQRARQLPPTPAPPPLRNAVAGDERVGPAPGRFSLTLKKEASDSSVLASKSVKKSTEVLPDVETFRASRSKTKSSLKMRRGYSLHCWLPDDLSTPIRASEGLSVSGAAIVPERKPRVAARRRY
ncbi:uncharacterized protein [Battus philenor]|uniref:uncharacterized protein n=1 Tax=Battus philenor TaxID=42288 RepID=UPI0035CF9EB9